MVDNENLLNLCRLNLLEEKVEISPHPDGDATLKVIDWKKRQLTTKIIGEGLNE